MNELKLIKVKHPYNKEEIVSEDIVLILGFFDGVHLAHQKVINKGIQIAKEQGMKAALMTFNRRPRLVYHKFNPQNYAYLTQYEQKYQILEGLGLNL